MNDLGVVLSSDYWQGSEVFNLGEQLENWGYNQISVPEIWGHDAVTTLAILANKTDKIALSSGIISMFSRTPGLVAMTAASLDEYSNGRFILGLGLSGPKVIQSFHGMNYSKPITRTREFVDVVRTLLRSERLNHSTSQLGDLKEFKLSVRNVRKDIQIHIASLGPKNVELTTQIADGWIPISMPIDQLAEKTTEIQRQRSDLGMPSIAVTPFIPTIFGRDENALNLLRGHLAYYFGGMGTKKKNFYNIMLRSAGFEEEAGKIIDLFLKGDVINAAREVTDEIIDSICIYGTKDEMMEKLARFYKAGVTRPLLAMPFRTPLQAAHATLQVLAPSSETI